MENSISIKMGNPLKNVTSIPCLKTMLFIFNIMFWITALLLTSMSIWANLGMFQYLDLPSDFMETCPRVMFAIYLLALLVTTVSFSWIMKEHSGLLYNYGAFLGCICMINAGIVASIACYRGTFGKGLYDGLIKNLANYKADNGDLDFAQASLRCCGVANYTDWVKISPRRVIPISCCINPTRCITANYSEVYQKGCYDVITEYILANMMTVIGFCAIIAFLPALGSALACSLSGTLEKAKDYIIA